MTDPRTLESRTHKFAEVVGTGSVPAVRLSIEDLRNVRLTVTADLGEASMLVRGILELKEGSVVPLDKIAGEMTDVHVNGIPIARGEIIVIADSLCVRIAEIFGVTGMEKGAAESEV